MKRGRGRRENEEGGRARKEGEESEGKEERKSLLSSL